MAEQCHQYIKSNFLFFLHTKLVSFRRHLLHFPNILISLLYKRKWMPTLLSWMSISFYTVFTVDIAVNPLRFVCVLARPWKHPKSLSLLMKRSRDLVILFVWIAHIGSKFCTFQFSESIMCEWFVLFHVKSHLRCHFQWLPGLLLLLL